MKTREDTPQTRSVAAVQLLAMTTTLVVFATVLGVLVVVGFVAGLALLFRNRQGARSSSASGLPALSERANVALMRLDDSLASAGDELGFAVAQFGEEHTAEFAEAVNQAKTMATSAFRLRKELDDAFPESDTRKRQLTLQMIAFSEKAQQLLDDQQGSFTERRSAELEAPKALGSLSDGIDRATDRIAPARATLARLAAEYRPRVGAEHEDAVAEAERHLASAKQTVAAATTQLSPSGVNAVTGEVATANRAVARATALLDSIDTLETELDNAAAAVTTLVAATRTDLAEAREQRDSAPDADSGAAILDAVDGVERVLGEIASATRPSDPIDSLGRLNAAIATLDSALATARNQAQRLEHARLALAGTLVSARSQLAAAKGFIGAGGKRVSADARARLSEAERELAHAEAEADPVEALDAARRAVTNARDADALARYDAMN